MGGDEPDDGDTFPRQSPSQSEVDVREVDEDRGGRRVRVDAADELAILGVDVGGVAEDFGDAHVGDVFGANDALLARELHVLAAEAGEGGGRERLAEGLNELRAVEVAGGLAGGDEEVRVGGSGDGGSLS